ncbi:hypothetical protein B296_00003223 [Ensete ventricosum]|uniref:Uncharacterized protein n=1 Tax=Ensete ventricosum TaxID=4639 RepID=A0A427B7W6_ENSVE|nr:hypothetical protein B296_00003223 [Ensete ventricosum]
MLQVKGLSKEELATRNDLVLALPDRIQSIPDGSTNGSKQTGSWTASRTEIRFDSTSGYPTHFGCVDKATSDLKNTNVRLKQTLDQVHFTTRCDIMYVESSSALISFTGFVFQLRSSRNFCIDIVLLCIILGIAAYLYK